MFAFYKLSTRIASSSYQTSNVAGRDDTVLAHHHADTHMYMYMYIVDRYTCIILTQLTLFKP